MSFKKPLIYGAVVAMLCTSTALAVNLTQYDYDNASSIGSEIMSTEIVSSDIVSSTVTSESVTSSNVESASKVESTDVSSQTPSITSNASSTQSYTNTTTSTFYVNGIETTIIHGEASTSSIDVN